jgi:antitoxin HigA-1
MEKRIMSIKNEGQAGWAVHPGEILRKEFLEPMGITSHKLAVELHVSPPTINDIVLERRSISPETAARLARYFGTSEQFWLNLQDAWEVHRSDRNILGNSGRSGPWPLQQIDKEQEDTPGALGKYFAPRTNPRSRGCILLWIWLRG